MLSILNIDNWETTTTTTLGWWKLPIWSVTLNNFVHRLLCGNGRSSTGKNRAFRLSSGEAKGWTGIERMKSLREERSGYNGSGCSAVWSEAYLHSPRSSWEPAALNKGSESEVGPALSHELHPTVSHRSRRSPHPTSIPFPRPLAAE